METLGKQVLHFFVGWYVEHTHTHTHTYTYTYVHIKTFEVNVRLERQYMVWSLWHTYMHCNDHAPARTESKVTKSSLNQNAQNSLWG